MSVEGYTALVEGTELANRQPRRPKNFPPKDGWLVRVPRDWLRTSSDADLRVVIASFDMMIQGLGTDIVSISGMGTMPALLQQFASIDQ